MKKLASLLLVAVMALSFAVPTSAASLTVSSPDKGVTSVSSETVSEAPDVSYHKDVNVEISSEPQYNAITADEPISTPLIIILVSLAVVILCAVAVTVTLVRDRNKQAEIVAGKEENEA